MPKTILSLTFLAVVFSAGTQRVEAQRQMCFDFDWKFVNEDNPAFSEPDFDGRNWTVVQTPHDWNITMNFDRSANGSAAYLPGTIGWYRKTFSVPKDWSEKCVIIQFGGIFHQSNVYINGKHLGFRPYGFVNIAYDLTPHLKAGAENVIAVRVDCTGGRPRWYAGSGIYRHVKLDVVDPVHIATDGTYVTTPSVTDTEAAVRIISTVENTTDKQQNVSISQRILDDTGQQAGQAAAEQATIKPNSTVDITQQMSVASPKRWDIDHPFMYTLETTVRVDNRVADVYTTPFGVRTARFDKDNGFFLNERHVKIKGMALHEDAGMIGVAVPVRANERRLEILKEYGVNAIRCAHNPPSTEFLHLCDRLGFIVIDEAFDKWRSGYYERYFDEWWKKDLQSMLIRDRNHPSVVMWSIGNEVSEAGATSNVGVERAQMLQDFVHRFEPTRPVTMAVQNGHQSKIAGVTDVIGYNYLEGRMLGDRVRFPERTYYISEMLPYYSGEEGNFRSYSTDNPWNTIAANDFIAGAFIWSGVDYLGESGFPSKGWPNGLFDITMHEKPRAAFHRAMWNPKPMVRIAVKDNALNIEPGRDLWQWPRIASHWNFPQYIGLILEVLTTANCETVELYFNDGRNNKLMGRKNTADYPNNTIVWNVPYSRGTLTAVAFNGEKEAARYEIKTTQGTHHLILTPDRATINADGQDISHIAVHLADIEGNVVQTDDRMITVTFEGEGRLRGIDSGDLRRETPFGGNQVKSYFGRALIVVQSNRQPGQMKINVTMEGSGEVYSTVIESKLP